MDGLVIDKVEEVTKRLERDLHVDKATEIATLISEVEDKVARRFPSELVLAAHLNGCKGIIGDMERYRAQLYASHFEHDKVLKPYAPLFADLIL